MATDFLGLTLPVAGSTGWASLLNANFDLIDIAAKTPLVKGVAAGAIAAYDVVVVDDLGTVSRARAASEGLSGGTFGMAVSSAGAGDTIIYRARGTIVNPAWSWSGARTRLYLNDATPGLLNETQQTGSPIMAVALSATSILFHPFNWPSIHLQTRFDNAQTGNSWYVWLEDYPAEIVGASIFSSTATSGSNGAKYWQFTLYNLTQANTIAQADTNADGEISADTRWDLGALANTGIAPHDVLELQVARVGGPSSWAGAEVMMLVEAMLRF